MSNASLATPVVPTKRRRLRWSTIIVYGLLLIGAIIVLYPFLYMVMNSVKPGREILHQPTALPSEITFSGYTGVFERLNMALLFRNSLILAVSLSLIHI